MAGLKLYLFGPPRLERNGEAVNPGLRKAMALLAYLAVTGQPHSRDALATLFWPDDSQCKARANLRRALSRLNVALGEGQLAIDREQASLAAEADLWLDVAHFADLLARCRKHNHPVNQTCPDCLPLLSEAISLYSGDFLAGFTLPDCPEFDTWQYFQTESLRRELANVLEYLVNGLSAQGDFESAILQARRWLALDPLCEPAHRMLMSLYAQSGQRTAALRQYQVCVRLLEEELGVPPQAETKARYEQIQGGLDAGRPTTPAAFPAVPRYNLPPQPTSFIGRQEELAEIVERLTNPNCRLLTLVGPGGSGKTRLAIEAAAAQAEAFAHGVVFVPLASVNPADFVGAINPLLAALAEALQYTFQGGAEPLSQILTLLQKKEILLLLDNFEHLLEDDLFPDTAEMVVALLNGAPRLKILVTSRERLHLQEEWLLSVQGLAFPTDDEGEIPQTCYSAVQLFWERARQIQADFDLATEYRAIVRICQLVEGMPLGLELAATWVRLMSCREIAQELEGSIDFLATTLRNLPERHRSLRVAFEHSWRLLSQAEKEGFTKLSLFQGGFLREAGEGVAGASLPLLSALVDRSLLHRTRSGRFEMHALLRQYAAEKLQTDLEAYEAIQEVHANYYADFLLERKADLKGDRQLEALAEIVSDLDNVRASWRWAVEKRDLAAIEKAETSLFLFCDIRGQFQEGEAAFRRAVAALGDQGAVMTEAPTKRQASVLGRLLHRQGWLAFRLGLPEAVDLMQKGVALLRRAGLDAQSELALALGYLSVRLAFEDYAKAEMLLQESLALAREAGDHFLMGFARLGLGQTAQYQGEYRKAMPHFQRSIDHFQQVGEQILRSYALDSWGRVAYAMGQYTQARELVGEALTIRQAFGNQIGIAYSLLDLGRLAKAQGDLVAARHHLQTSLAICEEVGGRAVIAWCLSVLGAVARLGGDFAEAEGLLQQSLALYREMGLVSQLPLCLNNLARLAYDQGAYRPAEQYLQESLTFCQQTDHSGELASTLRHLGHVACARGRDEFPQARQYFQQALEIVARTGAAPVALDVLVGWATLLFEGDPGDKAQAVELLTLAQAHPASEYETRQKTQRFLAELTSILPPDVFKAAQVRGKEMRLETLVGKLLGEEFVNWAT